MVRPVLLGPQSVPAVTAGPAASATVGSAEGEGAGCSVVATGDGASGVSVTCGVVLGVLLASDIEGLGEGVAEEDTGLGTAVGAATLP